MIKRSESSQSESESNENNDLTSESQHPPLLQSLSKDTMDVQVRPKGLLEVIIQFHY